MECDVHICVSLYRTGHPGWHVDGPSCQKWIHRNSANMVKINDQSLSKSVHGE